ncbi:sdhd-1 [Pristionchus pacificus]|nr:sdhd-1 [Pristionchus pacificus]
MRMSSLGAFTLRSAARVNSALLVSRVSPRICVPLRAATTLNDGASKTHDHSAHFKFERYFAAGMMPLIPAAYFVHGPVMDAALTIALTLHIHWGIQGVIADYARPFVIGDAAAKGARAGAYLITALLLAGLLHFNTNDVGITKAFEMVFSL